MSAGKQDPQGLERGKDDRDQGNFVPSEQRAEGKNENPNVIARAWEAAKESLGLGAWSDKQESQDEKKSDNPDTPGENAGGVRVYERMPWTG